jgi:D-3-phosphoglycerate dehydrogenase
MKVLITDVVDGYMLEGLRKLGYATDYLPDITQVEVADRISHYEGIIITSKISIDRLIIERSRQLKFIARLGSGMDHVDQEAAKAKGIRLITTPEANAGSVGEHAVGMLISLMHHFYDSYDDVRKGFFASEPYRVHELSGITVGILGYGHTGPEFAKRLQGFGVRVIGYDKYRNTFDQYCEKVSLQELQQLSVALSVHLPLTAETRNMVDVPFLKECSNVQYIINTSRGNIINLHALLQWLDEQGTRAASLDVLDNEHLDTYTEDEKTFYKRLINHKRIFITPHIAGKSHSTRFQHAKLLLEKLSLL